MKNLGSRSPALRGLALALVLLSPSIGRGLQFDVFAGYGGVVREVNWFPVTCEIMNDGPAFTGTIEISGTPLGSGQKRRLTLELPTNTRKRVMIPAFNAGGGLSSWEGRLFDASGELVAESLGVRVKEVAWESVLMGTLSRTFVGAPQFPSLQQTGSIMQPETGRIQPEQFPDNPIALEGLVSLYLNSEQALKLTGPQARSLTRWIEGGGHLILAIEQPVDVSATDWLVSLSPLVPISASQVATGAALRDWLVDGSPDRVPPRPVGMVRTALTMRSRLKADDDRTLAYHGVMRDPDFESVQIPIVTGQRVDGEVLLEVEGHPLVLSAERGRGQVTVLTFSPEREPFRSWKNKPWFWAKLNGVPYSWFDESRFNLWGGSGADGIFGSLIESRQVQKLPVKWLLLLLLVYLMVIGPFDRWFLKRIDRQMLTWLTFPAYVVLFSFLIYLIGYKLRSGVLEWNELHLVDVVPDQGETRLRGRSYGSIYSPTNRRYDLGCKVPGAVFRPEFFGMGRGVQGGQEFQLQQEDDATNCRVFVPVWTSQLYVADWSHRGSAPFSVTAYETGEGYEVRILNQSARRIERLSIVAEGEVYQLGGVGAGESRSETVKVREGESLTQYVQRHGTTYQNVLRSRQQAVGRTIRLSDEPLHSMVASFLGQSDGELSGSRGLVYPHGLDLSPFQERGDLVVLAFYSGYSPIAPLNQFEVSRRVQNALVRMVVTPMVEPQDSSEKPMETGLGATANEI